MFDLYLFDLDGTIINSEHLHYESYKETLKFFGYENNFNFRLYCKLCHLDDKKMREFVDDILNITYEKFYQKKKEIYLKKIQNNLTLIDGIDYLINKLYIDEVKTCIVTHTDLESINLIKEKFPILEKITKIFTKNDYLFTKPNTECYVRALEYFKDCKNPIGFEDSYKGYISLYNTGITSVFIGNKDYYYYDKMNIENMINSFKDYDESKINLKINPIVKWTENTINKYSNYINNCKEKFILSIQKIIPLINNYKGNIYLTGIGKSGHICKKSVSTWQSMGISCHYLNISDTFHGDFGILKNGDIIIYISNSGNIDEMINCIKYIKNNFKITQIGITINDDCKIKDYVNFHFSISNKVNEIDHINMAPTVSSVIFMIFLDMLGTYLAEINNLSIEKFKLYHPGGELGKRSSKKIDYIVILGSGLGTRLMPITKYINKLLVTYDNKPFIEYLIEYWQTYCKNIIIVINEKYMSLIKYYTQKYNDITIKNFDEFTGTADTIHKTITSEYYHKNLLFTWCDIIPTIKINLNKIETNIIFTYGNECRYKANNNQIYKDPTGNIVGLYYIKNYCGINNYMIGEDICDVYKTNFENFETYELEGLIDIGDMDKLIKNTKEMKFQTRFFNKITLINNKVIKESVNDQGDKIIEKEINWYKNIEELNFIPKYNFIDKNKFELDYINGIPLSKYIKNVDNSRKQEIINKIYENLTKLHQNKKTVDENIIKNDIFMEAYHKIKDRIKMITPIIEYFGTIRKVNGLKVNEFNKILSEMLNILLNENDNMYYYIHGDCQFSNTLIDDSNNIFFIDPRGYFGNTILYGLKEYDYAKVLYALTGYDEFNTNNYFSIDIENDEIKFNIENYINNDLKIEINDKIKAWLVIIWFGLAQYNSNNVLKCVASYYNGFYWYEYFFGNKLLNENVVL